MSWMVFPLYCYRKPKKACKSELSGSLKICLISALEDFDSSRATKGFTTVFMISQQFC
jgi:hypothetical protein